MATYAANQPCQEEVISKTFGLDRRAQLPSPSFYNVVTICGCFCGPRSVYHTGVSAETEGLSRDRPNPLALPENILHKRYRFSSEGIHYLSVLVGP